MRFVDGARLPSVTDYGIYGFFGEYRFLSNFHILEDPIYHETFWYYTSEAAYMATKSLDASVRETFSYISRSPRECKMLGQKIELRKDWELVKDVCMLSVLREKFLKPDMKSALLSTGVRKLEETNNWGDQYWGATVDPEGFPGVGKNKLGTLLMIVRNELRG